MPFVSVRITKEGTTVAQKAQVVSEITRTLQQVLGKAPELTHIVIEEVETEDWGHAGRLISEVRRGEAGKS